MSATDPSHSTSLESYSTWNPILCGHVGPFAARKSSSTDGTRSNSYELNAEMTAWCGETLYWAATILAGLLVAWVVWGYVYDSSRGEPIILIVPLLLAGAIWLAGWVSCKVLARH